MNLVFKEKNKSNSIRALLEWGSRNHTTIKQKSTEWCFRSVEKLRNFVARNTSQAYECEHSTPLLARRTPSNQRFEWSSRSHTTIKQKSTEWCFFVLWSEWRHQTRTTLEKCDKAL